MTVMLLVGGQQHPNGLHQDDEGRKLVQSNGVAGNFGKACGIISASYGHVVTMLQHPYCLWTTTFNFGHYLANL